MTNGCGAPFASAKAPIAVQLPAEGHATLFNVLLSPLPNNCVAKSCVALPQTPPTSLTVKAWD